MTQLLDARDLRRSGAIEFVATRRVEHQDKPTQVVCGGKTRPFGVLRTTELLRPPADHHVSHGVCIDCCQVRLRKDASVSEIQ